MGRVAPTNISATTRDGLLPLDGAPPRADARPLKAARTIELGDPDSREVTTLPHDALAPLQTSIR